METEVELTMISAVRSFCLAIGLALCWPIVAGAQPPSAPPPVPTTHILAIGTVTPGADMAELQKVLPDEVRATVRLYLDGKIDQWFTMTKGRGVVFVLNVTDLDAARAMLEDLPLGRAHLMRFELTPLGPLNPLRQLLGPPPASP
jgi:hypothetical protein